jgi:hypothetical protein
MADVLHPNRKTIYAYRVRIKDKLPVRDGNGLLREAIRWIESAGRRDWRATPMTTMEFWRWAM